MTKTQKAEQEEARNDLRQFVKQGSTVYCVLRHRSSSGMFRIIDLVTIEDGEMRWIGYRASQAIGMGYDRKRDGLRVSGCGMDMGFHVVYELAHALYGEGYALKHRWV